MRLLPKVLATAMLVTAVVGDQLMTAASAQQSTIGPSTPVPADTPDAFGERVRAYLLAHPEVIAEAVQILQRQQMAQTEAAQQTISTRADEIFHSPLSPVGGN